MELQFKDYARKVGSVSAAKVEDFTEVPGHDGNLRASPGDYVVLDGTKQVATWDQASGAGTKDVPVYAVLDGSVFESEHELVETKPAKGKKADAAE